MTVALYWTGEPWRTMAMDRARWSIFDAMTVPGGQHYRRVRIAAGEGDTVAECRNAALAKVETEWVIHLDADDELTPGYIEAMLAAEGDVRVPAVEYIQPDGAVTPAALWRTNGRNFHKHDGGPCVGSCLVEGNWVPIGAMVRAELLRSIGGWHDHPVYEDWCTWLRCHLAGATFAAVPSAVYRAYVRLDSRNRVPNQPDRAAVRTMAHREICAENGIRSVR